MSWEIVSVIVTKKNCMKLAQEIVDQHYDSIVSALGIPKVKVNVLDVDPVNGLRLLGQHEGAFRPQNRFEAFIGTGTYIPEKSKVNIYALSHLYISITSESKAMIRLPLTKKAFEKRVVNTLAHELRHAYQGYNKMYSRLISSIFYEFREEERDARAWASIYMKEVFK